MTTLNRPTQKPYHKTKNSCVQPELCQFKEILNFPNRRHCIFTRFLSNKSIKYCIYIVFNASFDVLIDKERPAVFAVGDDKKETGSKVYSHKTFSYFSADTPGPIPTELCVLLEPRDVIKMLNFCKKISRGFTSTRVKIPVFPLTSPVIVKTVLRAAPAINAVTLSFQNANGRQGSAAQMYYKVFSQQLSPFND